MNNFEKYKKEIKEVNYNFAITENGTICECNGRLCTTNCKFRNDLCNTGRIKWLYEDYKEPLLTNEEREYLKAVIKPFKEDFKYLRKRSLDETIQITCTGFEHVSLYLPHSMPFKNLQYGIEYSLEELGLD